MIGVCNKTIRRWDAKGKMACTRTPGGHRRVSLAVIEGQAVREEGMGPAEGCGRTAVYCRVSSHEQKAKGDLDRQVATATRHCTKVGLGKPVVFTDVGSGLNATRPGLARLCKQVEAGQVRTVVVSFKDRLTRFGFEYLRWYFASHGANIAVARQAATRSVQDELVEDLIAIVTSFSGRVHGMRGTHGKRIGGAGTIADPIAKAVEKAISDAIEAAVDGAVRKILMAPEIPRSGGV
jgi:predicted site-specific integrase-resolvase